MMTKSSYALPFLLLAGAFAAHAQGRPASGNNAPASAALATDPWEFGVFANGGEGVGDRSDFWFANAGVRLGKVMTDEHLGGIFRGQFEYAGELIPYWQSFTPGPHSAETPVYTPGIGNYTAVEPYNGGTFTGVSITPIILRWDLKPHERFAPYLQGAGGLIWTNHKYPPDVIVAHGDPGGTSVWNFTPQFGVGMHYFVRDHRALDLQVSAEHISSASLGDRNPGVNASIQVQVGYSWWK